MVGKLPKAQMQMDKLKKWCQENEDCKGVLQSALKTSTIRGIEANISRTAAGRFASQLKWGKKVLRDRRFSVEEKILALTTYKRGPKAYKLMQSMLAIPSPRTLISLLNDIPFLPGINKLQFAHLQEKISILDETDSACSLLCDQVSLSSSLQYLESSDCILGFEDLGDLGRENAIASYALVFMVHGLCKRWKQPVAYFFCNDFTKTDRLESLLIRLIESLQNVGLHILTIVCNQGTAIRGALQNLVASRPTSADLGKHGMSFNVNNDEVTIIFDPLHLIKSTRNAFMKYNVVWTPDTEDMPQEELQLSMKRHSQRAEASWDYLKLFAEKDLGIKYQIARKLTVAHIEPNTEQKTCVNLAVEVMSYSVASGIYTIVSNPALYGLSEPRLPNTSASALCTAHFVYNVDQLFDSFRGEKRRAMKFKKLRAVLTAKSIHVTFWPRMLKLINSWEFTDKTTRQIHRLQFQDGWLTTIAGATHIGTVLRKKYGVPVLRVRSLNQDVLINLICVIQQYVRKNTNPSCYHFISALKTSVINNLLRVNGWRDNRTALHDLHDILLSDLNVFLQPDEAEKIPAEEEIHENQVSEEESFQCFGPEDISDEIENENSEFNQEGFDFTSEAFIKILEEKLQDPVQELSEKERGIVAHVCSYVVQKVIDLSCEHCKSLVTGTSCEHTRYQIVSESREQGECSFPQYVSAQLITSVGLAAQVINKQLQTAPHLLNLKKQIEHQITSIVDFRWFDCEVHCETFLPQMISLLCRAMIHNFCKKLNHSFQQL